MLRIISVILIININNESQKYSYIPALMRLGFSDKMDKYLNRCPLENEVCRNKHIPVGVTLVLSEVIART